MTHSNESLTRKPSRGPVLDRPSLSVPCVDLPRDDTAERAHRATSVRGDRAAHRVFHGLYEDMLN